MPLLVVVSWEPCGLQTKRSTESHEPPTVTDASPLKLLRVLFFNLWLWVRGEEGLDPADEKATLLLLAPMSMPSEPELTLRYALWVVIWCPPVSKPVCLPIVAKYVSAAALLLPPEIGCYLNPPLLVLYYWFHTWFDLKTEVVVNLFWRAVDPPIVLKLFLLGGFLPGCRFKTWAIDFYIFAVFFLTKLLNCFDTSLSVFLWFFYLFIANDCSYEFDYELCFDGL